ncbi:unnamed protein product [Cylicostephanus goldi]|uniref:C-type lectin domain-containing protein n=1 Tax=Cylicostephanus goldi TaxID=71465 RepID=A0A3P6TBT1_CYLGO|nr:unnamed protein product [Cylicostephanus goldi]
MLWGMVYANHSSYLDASAQCSNDGGRLASIHDAFTNALIQDLAEKADTLVWLGLRCPDATVKNCRWDDGQGAPDQYNAFYPGNPSGIGECVFMMIDGAPSGKWVTGDCNNMLVGFVCEVDAKGSICFLSTLTRDFL